MSIKTLDRSLVEQFHQAIDNYQMDDRKINQLAFPLLAKHPQLVNIRLSDVREDRDSNSDYTPLHKAAVHLNLDLIRRLIALGADINANTRNKIVPLSKAITVGLSSSEAYQQIKLKAVEILLEAGADPNHRMYDGQTPLHNAAARRNDGVYSSIIGLLLHYGADPNAMSLRGEAPIHLRKCSLEALDLMMAHGADINLPTKTGQTPLLLSHCEDLPALLNYGANVHARDNYRRSALHYYVWDRSEDEIALLLQAGAKVDSRDRHGYTPLHHAVSAGNVSSGRALIARGADINAVSHLKETPLAILRSRKRLINDGPSDNISPTTPEERAAVEVLLLENGAVIASGDIQRKERPTDDEK